MKFGKFWQVIPVGVWVPWFAWRPVWDGCRYIWLERVDFKETYIGGAFGEHVYQTEWRLHTESQEQHAKGFHAGEKHAAKSIERGFCALQALDDDNLQAAIRALPDSVSPTNKKEGK